MRPRTKALGLADPVISYSPVVSSSMLIWHFATRIRVQRVLDVRSCSHRYVLEEESNPLASAPAQGRRRAVRAQSLAILHKVGCSWSARPAGVLRSGSAGPTTRPRFVPKRSTPARRQTGEPTVSHEGCSGLDSSSVLQGAFPPPIARRSRAIHPTARRVARPHARGFGAYLRRLQGAFLHAGAEFSAWSALRAMATRSAAARAGLRREINCTAGWIERRPVVEMAPPVIVIWWSTDERRAQTRVASARVRVSPGSRERGGILVATAGARRDGVMYGD